MPLFLPVGPGTPSSSLAKDATLSRSRSRVRIPPGSPNPPAGSGVVRKSRRLRKLQSKHQLACTTSGNTGGGTWHHRSCSPCSRFEASRGRIKRSSYRPAWCLRGGLEDLGDHRTDVLFSRIARTARASASCRARTTRKSFTLAPGAFSSCATAPRASCSGSGLRGFFVDGVASRRRDVWKLLHLQRSVREQTLMPFRGLQFSPHS